MAAVICFTITAGIIIFRQQLIGLFNTDPEVVRIGAEYLTIVNLFYIFFVLMFVIYGMLRGAGATLVPMFISVLSLWLIRIPIAAFLSKHIGETGIWWSIPIAWTVGMLLALLYYLSGKWKNKGVVMKPVEVKNEDNSL